LLKTLSEKSSKSPPSTGCANFASLPRQLIGWIRGDFGEHVYRQRNANKT